METLFPEGASGDRSEPVGLRWLLYRSIGSGNIKQIPRDILDDVSQMSWPLNDGREQLPAPFLEV